MDPLGCFEILQISVSGMLYVSYDVCYHDKICYIFYSFLLHSHICNWFNTLQRMNRWLKTDRHDVFETFRHRHKIAVGSTAAAVANSAIFLKTRCVPMPAYAAVNGTYLFLLFSGYVNPEITMR